MNIIEAVDRFGTYQRNILGRSENTIKNYRLDILQFAKILSTSTTDVSKEQVGMYAETLAADGMSAASRSRKLSAVQMFFRYLQDNEIVKTNPAVNVAKPKIPKKEVLVMKPAEVQKVLKVAKDKSQKKKNFFRNFALVSLLFATGMRRNEIVNVKLSDLDLKNNALLIREGKGDKQRIVYYNNETKALLSEYIVGHRPMIKGYENSDYLFLSSEAPKLSPQTVNSIVGELFDEAGLKDKGYTVHSTRKAFATAVYESTKDIVTVQNLLGHSSPETTMRYVGANEENKKRAATMLSF